MAGFGANVAIIKDGRVLLTKREDFEVWCLPGGLSDTGESLAQTAIREAKEETGYDVRLVRLVGVYSRVGGYTDLHGALFAAEITGGDLSPQVDEVIDTDWFDLHNLPDDIFWWHIPQIEDALKGVGGSIASVAHLEPGFEAQSRTDLYRIRDESNLSRTQLYRSYFESNGRQHHREVE